LRVLHDDPSYFQAAAFSSPSIAFHTGGFPEGLVQMLTRFEVNHGSGTAYAIGEHDWRFDPEAGNPKDPVWDDRDRALVGQAWLLKDPRLRSGGATNAYVVELFRSSALEQSPGWMEAVRTPILIGQVVNDKVAKAEAMSDACRRLTTCRLVSFQGTGHALFRDSDNARSRWMKALCSFFEKANRQQIDLHD
jgi:alpha-beta hydrolase superfamily lysophospholipase